MKKYLVLGQYNLLGTKHNSREEAEFAMLEGNCILDSWTGYCSAFDEFSSPEKGRIIEYDDEVIITKEEYEQVLKDKKDIEKKLKEEIARLREEWLGEYNDKIAIYHNQVKWQSNDEVEIITRQKYNHRLKIMRGRVYETVINKDGERMPALAQDKDRYVPDTHYIQGIKIVGNHRHLPNEHCLNCHRQEDGSWGKYCKNYDKENNNCKLFEELKAKRNEHLR